MRMRAEDALIAKVKELKEENRWLKARVAQLEEVIRVLREGME